MPKWQPLGLNKEPDVRVIAVWSIKGGVGKTTTAVALAALAAREGLRTLVWDLDPQGALSHWFRVTPRGRRASRKLVNKRTPLAQLVRGSDLPNLDTLPADLSHRALETALARRSRPTARLATKLAPLAPVYDWVFLDCAPSVTLVSEAVLAAANAVLMPVVPSSLSLRTLEQMRQFAIDVGVDRICIFPFLTMVDRRRRLHRENAQTLAGAGEFMRTAIPLSSVVERAAETLTPLPLAAPTSAAALAYAALWQELQQRLADPTHRPA